MEIKANLWVFGLVALALSITTVRCAPLALAVCLAAVAEGVLPTREVQALSAAASATGVNTWP